MLRNHSQLQGEVCVFRGCKVPSSWTPPNGRTLQQSDWCTATAERGADGDDITPEQPSVTVLLSEDQGTDDSDTWSNHLSRVAAGQAEQSKQAAAVDPVLLQAEAQKAAKNANVLMSKWDNLHSDQKQLSRAEAEYWASEAEADAGEEPGGVAGTVCLTVCFRTCLTDLLVGWDCLVLC